MRHVISHGMTTGMTTNGFLLTEDDLGELMDAGMGRIQISVDALNPTPGTPKSLKTLRKKIEMVAKLSDLVPGQHGDLRRRPIDEVEEVAEFCMDLGVAINFSVVHDRGRLTKASTRALTSTACAGSRTRSSRATRSRRLLPHRLLRDGAQGQPMDWTCQAGNKCFYVSADGDFHFCYHVAAADACSRRHARDPGGEPRQEGLRGELRRRLRAEHVAAVLESHRLIKLEVKRRASQLLPVLR